MRIRLLQQKSLVINLSKGKHGIGRTHFLHLFNLLLYLQYFKANDTNTPSLLFVIRCRGEDSFTANLAPSEEADPIELSDSAASKWGAKKLQRHPGEGFVALEGGKDKKPIDGQLVMFDDHFSFTWIPMKHTVFFSRPTGQEVIYLMRDLMSKEDEIDNMKSHLEHCYSLDTVTTATDQTAMHDTNEEPFCRILRSDDAIFLAEHDGKKVDATTPKLSFLKLNKLKGYLDDIFLG
jgi:hypothetical protein